MNSTPTNQPKFTDANGLVSLGLYKSKQAVFSAVARRKIPFYKDGRKLLFKPEEITTRIESTRHASVEELDQQASTYLLTRG